MLCVEDRSTCLLLQVSRLKKLVEEPFASSLANQNQTQARV